MKNHIVISLVLFSVAVAVNLSAQAPALTLDQCVEMALGHNLNLKATQQDAILAQHKIAEAKANLLPKFNGTVDYKLYGDLPTQLLPATVFGGLPDTYKAAEFGVPHNIGANVQGSLPLYNRAARSAIAAADNGVEMAELQAQKVREEIIWEVSSTYYNAQILANQQLFLQGNIVNLNKSIDAVQLLLQQQLASGIDLDRLKVQKTSAETRLSTVTTQFASVINALKFYTGTPQSDSLSVVTETATTPAVLAVERTPLDVSLTEQQIRLLESEKQVVRSAMYPSVGVYGLYGYTGYGKTGSNSFLDFYPISFVGMQANVPIFNGTLTKKRMEQKDVEIIKTNFRKEFLLEKNTLEKANAQLQLETARQNLETFEANVALAQGIFDKTQLLLSEGLATVTDLVLTDNTVREAQQDYIAALVQFRKAELEYKRTTGNLRF
ncbi:MAG: TolC family protein [Saprospiraceae bacterium]|nr:TolC family protein [Saprospiraceae bacterium]MCF8251912.1 TolC family protein [Saprospiraceae bacterium]MCF8281595.1 TolC family protein [Bacteroidales bacterium]MCF8313572.1 TolC family protein [Saprospiraceae bacterium]MCF8442296.1 TolC family protein [Saprospiraceae bacterium]